MAHPPLQKACELNSAVVEVATKVITSSPMEELKTDLYHSSPGLLEFEVTVPCIVNTAEIAGGAEIVVKWDEYENMYRGQRKADNKKRKVFDAFTVGAPKKQKQ